MTSEQTRRLEFWNRQAAKSWNNSTDRQAPRESAIAACRSELNRRCAEHALSATTPDGLVKALELAVDGEAKVETILDLVWNRDWTPQDAMRQVDFLIDPEEAALDRELNLLAAESLLAGID